MKGIYQALDNIEEALIFAGMLVMVTLNFLNVVCRFLLPQTPFSYTEELTILIFVWITMLGVSCAYKRVAHTGLTLVTDRLGIDGKKVFVVIATIASLIFMVFVVKYGFDMVLNQISHGQILPGMKIPAACQSLALPIGGIVIFLRVISVGVAELEDLKAQERGRKE